MSSTRAKTPRSRPADGSTPWWQDRMTVLVVAIATVVIAGVAIAVFVAARNDDAGPESAAGGFTGGDFHSLVADPVTPGRLFVGGHQAVSVSDDAGASWSRLGALDDADAMGWGFTDDNVWISGHPGIVMSTDGGATAARRNDALPDTDIHAFGAGGGALYAAGPNVGLLTSRDDGETWQNITTDDGQSFFGQILVDADDPSRLLAADAAQGPVASDDGGETWNVLTTFSVTWVSADAGFDTVYASGPDGAVASVDGGETWTTLDLPSGASLVEVDPHEPGRLYAGIHDGASVTVLVSDDQGRNWQPAA